MQKIKVVKKSKNHYIVNGRITMAKNFKQALASYINLSMAGAKIIPAKG